MIHKFVSNDNQGNVNTLEIGSDYTKISKVVDPVNDDDVANKKYVDQAGSSLPSVTSSDNGKVLAVEDGAWAAQERVVTLYANVNSSNEIILDDDNGYSFSELKAYAESGYSFICHLTTTGIGFDLTCPVYPIEIRAYGIDFAGEAVLDTVPFTRAYVRFEVYKDGDDSWGISGTFGGGNKYIVTLTPTALDYSGTMDKTVAEINAAYEAGMEIWFKLEASGMGCLMEMAGIGNSDPESTYPSFNAKFIASDTLLYVISGFTNDGTRQTYATAIYSLTPAS